MTDIVLLLARQGLSTIDRAISHVVLLLWISVLERQFGPRGAVESLAELRSSIRPSQPPTNDFRLAFPTLARIAFSLPAIAAHLRKAMISSITK